MKARIVFLALSLGLVAGCDAWFSRRIDVGLESAIAVPKESETLVLAAIREYAGKENIPCKDTGQLPIECWQQPIRIWAVQNSNIVTVCYSAMGIPLESSKFERRMDDLEGLIRKRGGDAVTIVKALCPKPPMFLNTDDLKSK